MHVDNANRRDVFAEAFLALELDNKRRNGFPYLLLEQYANKQERMDFIKYLSSYFGPGDIVATKFGSRYIVTKAFSKKKRGNDVRFLKVKNPKTLHEYCAEDFYFHLVEKARD